ncbi:MAG: hypothetical protein L0Y76_06550, partial [Ignavibacteria bacterium]|nr:hypothetical protein [Ignavibacteria bacterium]
NKHYNYMSDTTTNAEENASAQENAGTVVKKKTSAKIVVFWILAFLITAGSVYYQRLTGPTYPVSGIMKFQEKEVSYKLDRSCDTSKFVQVIVNVSDPEIKGFIEYKRHKTNDTKTLVEMKNESGALKGEFPSEKDRAYKIPAQKFEYQVLLIKDNLKAEVPEQPVVLRYKGDVPMLILLIHVIVIFAAMLVSTRAGLEFFNKEPSFRKLALWALGIMTIGGMILGPVVQKYAFGELWTGIPFGIDLTDNKTLIAWIAWIVAVIGTFRSKNPGKWVLIAALVTLVIFSIPHSVLSGNAPVK